MLKLDKNRPFAILFDGDRQMQFHYQDGKTFNMSTDEEVDLTSIAVKAKPAITCRFCNAKRETAEMMHEHLIARHGAQIARDKAAEAKAKEEAEVKTVEEPTNPETPETAEEKTEAIEETASTEIKADKAEEKAEIPAPKKKPKSAKEKGGQKCVVK